MHDNFSEQAGIYARYRPDYPTDLYEFIFSHLTSSRTAWDCATGSGQVASYLARHFEKVYASDISAQQMSHAPRKDNIKYVKVPAEDSGFPSGYFDLITVAQAIHWFDMDRFYGEVRRTAAPNALLAVIGYGFIRVDENINPVIDRFYNDMFTLFFNKARTSLDQRYQTIPFPFEEIPPPPFEHVLRWSRNELEGYFNSWSSVQKYKNVNGTNPVDHVITELEPYWPEGEHKEVTFPVFIRLGRVRPA